MEKTLRARPGNTPVSEDDKDREIQLLESEVHLAQVLFHMVYCFSTINGYNYYFIHVTLLISQIEIKEYRQKAEESPKILADIERQRQSLKRKLARANQERDSLANDIIEVQVESRTLKSRLTSVGAEHEAAIKIAESLTKVVENKDFEATNLRQEKMELEEKLKQSDNVLQIVQIQVSFYMTKREWAYTLTSIAHAQRGIVCVCVCVFVFEGIIICVGEIVSTVRITTCM